MVFLSYVRLLPKSSISSNPPELVPRWIHAEPEMGYGLTSSYALTLRSSSSSALLFRVATTSLRASLQAVTSVNDMAIPNDSSPYGARQSSVTVIILIQSESRKSSVQGDGNVPSRVIAQEPSLSLPLSIPPNPHLPPPTIFPARHQDTSVGIPIAGQVILNSDKYSDPARRSWAEAWTGRSDVHSYEVDGSSGSTRIRTIVSDTSVGYQLDHSKKKIQLTF